MQIAFTSELDQNQSVKEELGVSPWPAPEEILGGLMGLGRMGWDCSGLQLWDKAIFTQDKVLGSLARRHTQFPAIPGPVPNTEPRVNRLQPCYPGEEMEDGCRSWNPLIQKFQVAWLTPTIERSKVG